MERVKKWLGSKKLGSMESLTVRRPVVDGPQRHSITQLQPTQSNYELTSVTIKHLLENKQFDKVVENLRELPREYVLGCLESFPFIALNKTVPKSFLIWETLLTKLNNSEEGYIPQFPYKACDELVISIAWLLENSSEEAPTQSCKRVLKCVYMQYNEVLEHLYKEHDRVTYALYTLGLHSMLGTDPRTALTIEAAIKEEARACVEDYSTALERLEDFRQDELVSFSDVLREGPKISPNGFEREGEVVDTTSIEMQMAPNPTQVQLHERLYQNQRVFTALQPSRRSGTLQQLLELLNERIHGDKEVISIYGRLRDRSIALTDSIPVQPWLRKYQHALDLAIGTLKDIEKDLEITIPRVDSPMQLSTELFPPAGDEGLQMVPVSSHRPRSRSYEQEKPSSHHRHSITPILTHQSSLSGGEEDRQMAKTGNPRRILSVPHTYRPRSASPHKFLRVNGSAGLSARTTSMKSISSDSSSNLGGNGASSSVHDLYSTSENPPSLPFTRVQSLKSHNSVQVVAGKRKKGISVMPNSYTNISSPVSVGSVNGGGAASQNGGGGGKKHKKSINRSDSGELSNQQWDRQNQESANSELMAARKAVHDLRKRERELTDRLSEQAQRHLHGSEKFEDILLGSNRPTLVIQRYSELYSQGRVEALDAMDRVVQELAPQKGRKWSRTASVEFRISVLLDVLKMSYMECTASLEHLNDKWKACIGVSSEESDKVAVRQLESAVALYMRRMSSKHDVTSIVQNVRVQLSLKYADSDVFRLSCETEPFILYMQECAQICWDLCVQTPPMVLDYHETEFSDELHTRFYNSDMSSTTILHYHWPTLLQTSAPISRGVVQT